MTQLVEKDRSEADERRGSRLGPEPPAVYWPGALFSFRGRPGGVAPGSDDSIWVSDSLSAEVWQVTVDGNARSVIGPSVSRHLGDKGTAPLAPAGLAEAPDGSLYVADSSGHRVCAVTPDGRVRVVAGGANGYRDGEGTEALFRYPLDVAFAPDGACYVADSANDRIRRIAPDGTVTTVAGSIYDWGDGRGPHARFRRPGALDVGPDGTCYVADTGNNAIRLIEPDGAVTTLAGEPPGGDADGIGRGVGLRWPTGIATGPDSSAWVVDRGNGAVRHIAADGKSSTALRLSGERWPLGVALRGDGVLVAVGTALDDLGHRAGCLFVVGSAA